MNDLISRQAAIDYCYQLINVEHQQGSDEMNYGQERVAQTETILHHLEVMPSAQPRKGKWAGWGDTEGFGIFICDRCGKFAMMEYDFCPNCGADMREVRE